MREKEFLNNLNLKKSSSREEDRNIKLDTLMDDSKFYIEDEDHFQEFESMRSVYDTETRELNQYMRFHKVEEFIQRIGFKKHDIFSFFMTIELIIVFNDTYINDFDRTA